MMFCDMRHHLSLVCVQPILWCFVLHGASSVWCASSPALILFWVFFVCVFLCVEWTATTTWSTWRRQRERRSFHRHRDGASAAAGLVVVALVSVYNDNAWRQHKHQQSPLFPRRLLSPPPPMLNTRTRTSDCRRSSTSTSCANGCGRCSTRQKRDTASRCRAHHPNAANHWTPVHHHTLADRRTKLADRNASGSKRPVATSLVYAGKPTTASLVQHPRLLRALRSRSLFWTGWWRSIPWRRWNFDILLILLVLFFFCNDLLLIIY